MIMTLFNKTDLPHSTQFAEKWAEWLEYKREIKDSYKSPKSAQAKAKQLAQYTEQVAIQMIEQSIADGYKGIFPLKTTNGKTVEPTQVYKEPEAKAVSTYQPTNTPSEDERKVFIVGKIRLAYEGKIALNDIGGVFTNRLKHLMDTPDNVMSLVVARVQEQDRKQPRNRFEELPEINVELEIRNQVLRYHMNCWQREQRDVSKEL